MAEKRTIDINIKNNADEATKDFNTFNDALDETAKSAKNVNSTFEEVYGDLQPLTTRLGEAEDRLYELALAGDTTSKEYQELLEKVGAYRKVQMQTDLAVDGASQTFIQKLAPAINGVTSAYLASQGALTLYGEENEELNETLKRIQGALAIQQGVQGLTEAYKQLSIGTKIAGAAQSTFAFVTGAASTAMKVFRLALVGTGIGAIVVALGALIANFDKIAPVVKKVIDVALMPMKLIIDGLINTYYALTDALGITSKAERQREKQAKINAANAKKRADERKKEFKNLQEEIKRTIGAYKRLDASRQKSLDKEIALLKASGKETRNLERQKLVSVIDTEAKILQERIKTLKASEKAGNRWVQMQQKLILAKQVENAKDAEFELRLFDAETNKIKADNYRQYVEERKEADQEALDEEIDAEIQLLAELDKIRQENEERFRTDEENELNAVAEKYDVLEAMAYGNAEALNEIEIARLNEENEIKAKYATEAYNAQKALDDKAAEEEKQRRDKQLEDIKKHQEREQQIRMATVDTAIQGFQLIADFAESFAGDDVKRQKKAFQIKKAADIAAATVDGYRAILNTYAQTPGGPVLKGIAAGVAGGFAALQIANIARQKFEGGDTSGGDFSADTGGGAGEVITPEFNVVGDAGINQLAQLQQQPTQAYVVSGEVTSAQALDRNRVTNATL